ncbi:prepilin peptidase [Actinoplanes sp. M2I2]|uniref:prepilin peptidase n=1 Tax=Actinoplanes sp. M2I2 TaxID=1734444 RepID=UPI00202122F0|nr:prepilin peptidase [Actinoplanes sp. M2I2]
MSLLLVISAAAFGGSAAAYLPHVAHRLAVPFGEPPRSACASCGRRFVPGPGGWVRVGACCASRAYGLTVVAGAAVSTLLAVALGPCALLPVHLLAVVPGLLLALIDLRCLRLPDRVVAVLAVVTVPPSALLAPDRIGTALVAGGLVLTAYLVIALLPGAGLGLGDVKLATVLAVILGFAGWPAVITGLVVPHLINGPIALALLLARRGRPLPFGPALLAGALVAVTTA